LDKRFDAARDHRGVSALPVVILVALFLFLALGPFSRTAGELFGPLGKLFSRAFGIAFSWFS